MGFVLLPIAYTCWCGQSFHRIFRAYTVPIRGPTWLSKRSLGTLQYRQIQQIDQSAPTRIQASFHQFTNPISSQHHQHWLPVDLRGAGRGLDRVTNGVPPLSTTNLPVRLTPFVTPTGSPYPLVVMLIMLTSRGSQGAFVLKIE